MSDPINKEYTVNTILSVIFALTAMFAPAQPAQPVPFHLPPALTVQCEEDQPCWDCHTMGNHTCNVSTEATKAEAWATFDTYTFKPSTTTRVEYVRTLDAEPAHLPMTQFTLESNAHKGTWHIFQSVPTAQPTASTAQPTQTAVFKPTASKPTASPAKPSAWLYDCDTTGVKQCTNRNLGDAWESFDAVDIRYTAAHPLAYTATVHAKPTATAHTVIVKSINHANTWHVFTRH